MECYHPHIPAPPITSIFTESSNKCPNRRQPAASSNHKPPPRSPSEPICHVCRTRFGLSPPTCTTSSPQQQQRAQKAIQMNRTPMTNIQIRFLIPFIFLIPRIAFRAVQVPSSWFCRAMVGSRSQIWSSGLPCLVPRCRDGGGHHQQQIYPGVSG